MNSASSHNSFYVERNITDYYQDNSLWNRIAGTNGYDEMEGIYPGCYFDMNNNIVNTINGGSAGVSGNHKSILILGCNCNYNQGDSANYLINYNHITVCPLDQFGIGYMNDTDTTIGGYLNSKMNLETIGSVTSSPDIGGTINQKLLYEFSNHLKTHVELLTSSINENSSNRYVNDTGASKGWNFINAQAILMSEVDVYGSNVFSSSGFDDGIISDQYPAFRINRKFVNPRTTYWFRNVATKNRFSAFNFAGQSNPGLSSSIFSIRPRFILS